MPGATVTGFIARPVLIRPTIANEMAPDNDKIAGAVATCLAYAITAEHPLQQAADLAPLLQVAGWTEADICEIQARVRSCLMRRRIGDGRTVPTPARGKLATTGAALAPGGAERRRNRPSESM